jgi:hypothetical protein
VEQIKFGVGGLLVINVLDFVKAVTHFGEAVVLVIQLVIGIATILKLSKELKKKK